MPLFPLNSFSSLTSLASFPSVSSLRNLLDPEPQVFYPAPKSPTRRRERERRDSTSSTRSTASLQPGGQYDSPARRTGLGRLEGASRSAVDVTGWEGVENPLLELGRRHSLSLGSSGQKPVGRAGNTEVSSPLRSSPSRPSHRRAHSALPTPGYPYPRPASSAGPRGRLTEFSRNALASSSAISLPTLCESEVDDPADDQDTTPLQTRLYRRLSTQATIIIPSPPLSPTSSYAGSLPSPLSLNMSLGSHSSNSSVDASDYFGRPEEEDSDRTPQPKRRMSTLGVSLSPKMASSVPPPQRVARLRPPPSPRSLSDQPARSRQRVRTQSLGPTLGMALPLGRSVSAGTGSTVSTSDVAVMATWAFPSSPERMDPQPSAHMGVGEPSGRLKERLQALSMLDTSSSSAVSEADSSTLDTPAERITTPAHTTQNRAFQFPSPHLSHLGHRHAQSSPHALAGPCRPGRESTSGPPVARPSHRRTLTPSRLRSPQLLSLPLEQTNEASHTRHPARAGIGRRSSSSLLPPSSHAMTRTQSAVDALPSAEVGKAGGGWWRLPSRRASVGGDIPSLGSGQMGKWSDAKEAGPEGAVGDKPEGGRARREPSPETDRFIDFDDM
ncbi:uncharacterized protein MKK02DRAFT_37505 [Dioszegia hungarica]|uniref:Uncharacterized protein n=1 Tax=Dioszegia hungarica TaxID=4972 RepID=A0AA38H5P5_9TREE|nr:uncharacterized protein MKK02DRAFT_37505 [Dioszegia hungarica]KAI9634625.1 hypothetical protein MKK02DRAFT_37505 [Dioszegia hungarica]